MRFETALKKLDGESVGGQLIAKIDGKSRIIGRHLDGQLIVADDPEVQAIVEGLTDDPLDHDNNGVKGGDHRAPAPRKPRAKAPAPTDPQPAADPQPEVDATTADTSDADPSDPNAG